MKGKKTMTILVAIALVASTMVVLDKLTDLDFFEEASAAEVTPGSNYWQGTNISDTNNHEILHMTVAQLANLKYGETDVDITFNGSVITSNANLYKPTYNTAYAQGTGEYEVWVNWTKIGSGILSSQAYPVLQDIDLDVAGLWLVVADDAPTLWKIDMSNLSVTDPPGGSGGNWERILGWFWVNSSVWTVDLSASSVYYDKNESLTITVKDSSGSAISEACFIDIWNTYDWHNNPNTGRSRLAYHKELSASANGVWTISGSEMYTFTHTSGYGVGNYRVTAYAAYSGGTSSHSTALNIYGASGGSGYNTERGYNATFGNTTFWPKRFIAGDTGGDTNIRSWNALPVFENTWQDTNGAGTTYKWNTTGPFDPPEYWADYTNFSVLAGIPSISIINGTQFWNDTGQEVELTLKDYDGNNLAASGFTVQLFNKTNRPTRGGSVNISSDYFYTNDSGNTFRIQPIAPGNRWGWNSTNSVLTMTWAPRGNVYIVVKQSTVGNSSFEWNGTAIIKLTSASNRFVWVNDGDTPATDGELGQIPALTAAPMDIAFKIQGSDYAYFGTTGSSGSCQNVVQCAENITITGDSLFTGDLVGMPNYANGWFSGGTWTIPIIPTMALNGGEITITAIAWNASIVGRLSVGGTNYWQNGTVVTVTPNVFDIDVENKTLDVTVQTAAGVDLTGATVTLYYIDESAWASTPAGPMDGAGQWVDRVWANMQGGYSIHFNTTQQTTNQSATSGLSADMAPRNLTVVATSGSMRGYALIRMNPNSDLEVEISRSTMIAGYKYTDFYINCTLAGNTTDTPSTTDKAEFSFFIYDGNGNDVSSTVLSGGTYTSADIDDNYNIHLTDLYITAPGTYTIYAKNNTHDSEGFNATLVVEQVEVTCDKSPLIWKHDENISATFSVRLNGEPIEGTLRIDNISSVGGEWNNTWKNTSFDGASDNGGTQSNVSIEVEEDALVNGDVTINDLTADYLPLGSAMENITFWFAPLDADGNPGEYARTSGKVPVQVPTVTPSPQLVALGAGTVTINIVVTGRDGTLLPDYYVGLNGAGILVATANTTSNTDGVAQFSINPSTTGDIAIHVGAEGRVVSTKITVTGWSLDVSADAAQVDEGGTFTVTVMKQGTTTAVEDADVTINGIGTIKTGSDGKAIFTAPEITSDRTYTITARAEGYAPDSDALTMTVVNVPKLTVTLSPSTAQQGADVKVTVSKDDANPAVNAKVTIEGSEYYTDGNGQATITTPSSDGTYTVTAAFGTFQDGTATLTVSGSGGIPGFELLTLIIALGVAFILLRRRRR